MNGGTGGLQAGGGGTSQATRGVRWLLQSKRQANGSFLDDVGVTTGEVQQTALAWLAIEALINAVGGRGSWATVIVLGLVGAAILVFDLVLLNQANTVFEGVT